MAEAGVADHVGEGIQGEKVVKVGDLAAAGPEMALGSGMGRKKKQRMP